LVWNLWRLYFDSNQLLNAKEVIAILKWLFLKKWIKIFIELFIVKITLKRLFLQKGKKDFDKNLFIHIYIFYFLSHFLFFFNLEFLDQILFEFFKTNIFDEFSIVVEQVDDHHVRISLQKRFDLLKDDLVQSTDF